MSIFSNRSHVLLHFFIKLNHLYSRYYSNEVFLEMIIDMSFFKQFAKIQGNKIHNFIFYSSSISKIPRVYYFVYIFTKSIYSIYQNESTKGEPQSIKIKRFLFILNMLKAHSVYNCFMSHPDILTVHHSLVLYNKTQTWSLFNSCLMSVEYLLSWTFTSYPFMFSRLLKHI